MKKSWCFAALLILFSFLGFYNVNITEPNQEIVLKFADVNVTSDETQSAILSVKEQLQSLGINSIKVKALKDGQLKISYYSDADVESIKKTLSEKRNIEIAHSLNSEDKNQSGLPHNKNQKSYKLDVFEINKSNDAGSGFGGKFVLNLKQDYDRFYNPNVYVFDNDIDENRDSNILKVALKVFLNVASEINNSSRNIPEVRAGPTTFEVV